MVNVPANGIWHVFNVNGCARCSHDHVDLPFKHFERPIIDGDGTQWDWWALCPVTAEPILLRAWSACHDTIHIDLGTI